MARQKAYKEEEVIEKAMNLFWRNGYETTSTRMLEKEMGINQFSIYSSFSNKQGVLLQSIKQYKNKLKPIIEKLKESLNGTEGIKQYFYDFIEFTKHDNISRGCLIVNTVNELGEKIDSLIMSEIIKFVEYRDDIFKKKLESNSEKNAETILRQTNFLSISMGGLAIACKVNEQKQIEDFIETTFENI